MPERITQQLIITLATTPVRFDPTSTLVLMDQMNYFLY